MDGTGCPASADTSEPIAALCSDRRCAFSCFHLATQGCIGGYGLHVGVDGEARATLKQVR